MIAKDNDRRTRTVFSPFDSKVFVLFCSTLLLVTNSACCTEAQAARQHKKGNLDPVESTGERTHKIARQKSGEIQKEICLNASSEGRVFEGIGAVSAGASSRLLCDYPEPQRKQILDYLFKPKFGASFQDLKVEVGCGENSTCGSEPSHVITRDELAHPKARGYEFWLMSEARKRNPRIILDCLPWGYPRWVGDRFSKDSAEWLASFLEVARSQGLELDWLSAAQNENCTDLKWIFTDLHPTLVAHGFSKIRLLAPDDENGYWQIFDRFEKDPEASRLVSGAGYHYLAGREPWDIDEKADRATTAKARNSGKSLWASEEWSQSGASWDKTGALYLARLINKVYTCNHTNKFQIWCPVDSIYNQIIWPDTGVMQADTPWSGHYNVWPAVWAVAHTTQFTDPGWIYMDSACGQLDPQTWRGSYTALRNAGSGDWSLIVVTGAQKTIRVKLQGKLKDGPVHVWKSNATAQFAHLQTLTAVKNQFKFELEPESIYTFSTTSGQQKGSNDPIPEQKPFPFPFKDDFEKYQVGDTAKYFSDQKGTFEVCRNPQGGLCLGQIVPAEGILWFDNWLLKPHTLYGDINWQDCSLAADVLLAGGDVEIGGRYADRNKLGYRWILTRDGRWQLNWQYKTLAAGQLENFDARTWHHLQLSLHGDTIEGSVDSKQLCSLKDRSGNRGMAFLSSTYDHNLFDNVMVEP